MAMRTMFSDLSTTPPVVLVVEDQPLLRLVAVDMIEEAGFTALEAADAMSALNMLRMRQDIAFVFSDVDMPGAMNGIDLIRYIRALNSSIKIIVTSGTFHADKLELPSEGIFLPKPYLLDDVSAALQRFTH